MCYCPTPTLHLNLALTGDGAFLFSPQKTHSVWFISVLNYGDTENVLINHLLLVIPVSYPCHYTNLCPHKPHKHAHTHRDTHTHSTLSLSLTHIHTHSLTYMLRTGSVILLCVYIMYIKHHFFSWLVWGQIYLYCWSFFKYVKIYFIWRNLSCLLSDLPTVITSLVEAKACVYIYNIYKYIIYIYFRIAHSVKNI